MSKNAWLLIGLGVLILLGGGGAAFVINSNYSPLVNKVARAIGIAERGSAEIDSGNVLNNNPGDIEDGAGNLIQYATLEDGWNALLHQVHLFFGGSKLYNPSMTINQVAYLYADGAHDPAGAQAWASNVAAELGVSPDTPLSSLTA